MGKAIPEITDELGRFITSQPVFFVATAPLSPEGHINLSPKGLETFAILSPTEVAYLDLTGSGNETSAHLLENGRLTFMFCSFSGPPRIVRLYGRGRTVLPADGSWTNLRTRFGDFPGVRQIVTATIERVQTSCGFGVPLMEHHGPRDTLLRWAESKGPSGLAAYIAQKNGASIDGLPTPIADALGAD
ncbi:MAG TPA: pyridoxamine 5'-phosphate oxidase family protein [Longimicrobiales bacterium]|nr:pyridoxamine 5'-phosphate oxidase family protein [Longimicrobiales bacterium]